MLAYSQDTRDPLSRPSLGRRQGSGGDPGRKLAYDACSKPVTLKMTKKTKHLADLVMEDENNNEVNNGIDSDGMTEDCDQITLYVRAGCDNRKYGACPFCQRIFMFLMLKSEQGGKRHLPDARQCNYPFYGGKLCDIARFFLPYVNFMIIR